MKLSEIASKVGAKLENCSEDMEISGVAAVAEAQAGQIVFVITARDFARAKSSRASAVILPNRYSPLPVPMLRAKNPFMVFARVMELLYTPPQYEPGIHPTAVIHESAKIGARASIGAYVVIDRDVEIGPSAVLLPHVVIYRGVRIGRNFFAHAHSVVREYCRLGDNAVLQNGAVIGSDAFFFVKDFEHPNNPCKKVASSGPVVIGDDAEVQANACVERGTTGETRIGNGVKINNLVEVGHDSRIGENTLLCGQAGLAGEVTIGNNVVLCGQVGVTDHCKIGDGAYVKGRATVARDVRPNEVVSGYPAINHKQWLRCVTIFSRLPQLGRALHERPTSRRQEQAAFPEVTEAGVTGF